MKISVKDLRDMVEMSGYEDGEVKLLDSNGDEVEIATLSVDVDRNILIQGQITKNT